MWTVLGLALVVLAVAVVGAAASPPDVREALATAKNLYVATKRKDGSTSKASPIWFMVRRRRALLHDRPDELQGEAHRQGQPGPGLGRQRAGPALRRQGRDPARSRAGREDGAGLRPEVLDLVARLLPAARRTASATARPSSSGSRRCRRTRDRQHRHRRCALVQRPRAAPGRSASPARRARSRAASRRRARAASPAAGPALSAVGPSPSCRAWRSATSASRSRALAITSARQLVPIGDRLHRRAQERHQTRSAAPDAACARAACGHCSFGHSRPARMAATMARPWRSTVPARQPAHPPQLLDVLDRAAGERHQDDVVGDEVRPDVGPPGGTLAPGRQLAQHRQLLRPSSRCHPFTVRKRSSSGQGLVARGVLEPLELLLDPGEPAAPLQVGAQPVVQREQVHDVGSA